MQAYEGMGQPLPTTRVNHGTLQWPLVEVRLHINVLELRAVRLTLLYFGAGNLQSVSAYRVGQYGHSVVRQQTGRSGLQDPQQ